MNKEILKFEPAGPDDYPPEKPDNSKPEPVVPPVNPIPEPFIPDYLPDDISPDSDDGEESEIREVLK